MRLNQAMIYVKDLNRMAAFYGNILGLKPVEEKRMENWVCLSTHSKVVVSRAGLLGPRIR
jgi:catechol-2,3-dioxygenase